MPAAYVIGSSCMSFGKLAERSFQDLTREVYLGALADADLSGGAIEQAWFGNSGMGAWGQGGIRGQVCFTPLVKEGLFPERVPMINVASGCATASQAAHCAWKDILSGEQQMTLALGVEKLYSPDKPACLGEIFNTAIDQLEPRLWHEYYAAAGAEAGKPFETGPNRTVFMGTYAMQAAWHMKRYGTTQRKIAIACSKNHKNGT